MSSKIIGASCAEWILPLRLFEANVAIWCRARIVIGN
jgi:hypothetical protein